MHRLDYIRLVLFPPPGPFSRLRNSVLAIAAVILVGTGGYMRIVGASFLDALFMTVITISTVGYNLSVPHETAAARVFTIALVMASLIVIAWAVHGIVSLAFANVFWSYIGRQRMQSRIDRLRRHTIVCGYGRMGRGVVLELEAEGEDVVIVEPQESPAGDPVTEGHLTVEGDATRDDVLLRAGIERARALIAVTASDANNVLIALSARALNPDVLIAARADYEESVDKLHRAGVDYVLPHHGTGAMHLALFVTHPVVEDVLTRLLPRQGELDFGQLRVRRNTWLVGKTLAAVGSYRSGALILALKRGEELHVPPDPQLPLEPGDVLVVAGSRGSRQRLAELTEVDEERL